MSRLYASARASSVKRLMLLTVMALSTIIGLNVLYYALRDNGETMNYHGGPVLQSTNPRIIYWEPSNYSQQYRPGEQSTIKRYFADVSANSGKMSNVYGVLTQYRGNNGYVKNEMHYQGSYIDRAPAPASDCNSSSKCFTTQALTNELSKYISAHNLPEGLNNTYYLMLPPGITHNSSEYCGYHSSFSANNETVVYAIISYAGAACFSWAPSAYSQDLQSILDTVTHETAEMITDPLPNADPSWNDSQGVVIAGVVTIPSLLTYTSHTHTGEEVADPCAQDYGPTETVSRGHGQYFTYNQVINHHRYLLVTVWSNQAKSCTFTL